MFTPSIHHVTAGATDLPWTETERETGEPAAGDASVSMEADR